MQTSLLPATLFAGTCFAPENASQFFWRIQIVIFLQLNSVYSSTWAPLKHLIRFCIISIFTLKIMKQTKEKTKKEKQNKELINNENSVTKARRRKNYF